VAEIPNSCVFWGRLDFVPNIDAVQWFVREVWPGLRASEPTAVFTLIGFNPVPEVRALDGRDGIRVLADVPDLRDEVCRHAVVVLPFRSGGGIKNKLLEAAAMGRAIVCSARALSGLSDHARRTIIEVDTPSNWRNALSAVWTNTDSRRNTAASRAWVTAEHSWHAVAFRALGRQEPRQQREE
jgi:glycosyltransferase involved in cell wall biosynthesis